MSRSAVLTTLAALANLLLASPLAFARPQPRTTEWAEPEVEVDVVGDVEGTEPTARKAQQDTTWIASWPFESGSPCVPTGWTIVDNRVINDGTVYWHIEAGYSSSTGIAGNAAAMGAHDNGCCVDPDGYGNDWYQAIRARYTGSATLSLDYMVDTEPAFDFLQVESDSGCASFSLVDFDVDPGRSAREFRNLEFQVDDLDNDGEWVEQPLIDYGFGVHCLYIVFISDVGVSPCDGGLVSSFGEGAIVDNIVIVDNSGTRTENFEDGLLDDLGPGAQFMNLHDSVPFGTWARLFNHVTDNDVCTENKTCSWLWSDHTTPTLANDPSMAFGPGTFVVRNWLDEGLISPWVSLASTPAAAATVMRFRRFPGNFFTQSRIVQNWSVRGRVTIDQSKCLSTWGHSLQWNSLSFFGWQTVTVDLTPHFDPVSEDLQVQFRTSDWQWIAGATEPPLFRPGPGPYLDHPRIGRRILSGPVIDEGIDARSQAQDAFPGVDDSGPGSGPQFEPTTDRFGTVPFSEGTELGINKTSPNLIMGDSITISVQGLRPGGETVTSVTFSGAIVSGPHMGKAPPPHVVGANGFFTFQADSSRATSGAAFVDLYFVDVDDTYFRGGDVLHYFWAATDAGGGFATDPVGMNAMPTSVAQAQQVTGGILEVSFLPKINWAASYLAAIGASPNGDINPTAGQIAASSQASCILYVNNVNARRLSGKVNRTSFMYALDRLGYEGKYDVYDHTGMGNTNNQLAGRATVQQAQGYNLIVYDNGDGTPGRPLLPNGVNIDSEKIDQASWFRNWLNQGAASEAHFATLWIIGSNTTEERGTDALIATDMGVSLVATDQLLDVNPTVNGITSFVFDQGIGTSSQAFTGDLYLLNGGCPVVRNYDALGNAGSAIRTHQYTDPSKPGVTRGAIVMNRNNSGAWNTIMQSHPWGDIRDDPGVPETNPPERILLTKILNGALPLGCISTSPPTDTGDRDGLDVPRATMLYPNVPNPFNPTTRIRFDLAEGGRVVLRIYDVAGRQVRSLLDEDMAAGHDRSAMWDGLDDDGQRAASGVYFYRLDAGGKSLTRKLVVMK